MVLFARKQMKQHPNLTGIARRGLFFVRTALFAFVLVLNGGCGGAGDRDIVDSVSDSRAQVQSKNNIRQIAIAFHDYNDSMGRLPPAIVYDKTGKPLYSWRVLILPYLEGDPIYKRFHFHEAWDSPHNRELLSLMPRCYAHPKSSSKTDTHYQVFNGPGALYNVPMTNSPPNRLTPFRGLNLPQGVEVFEAQTPARIPASFQDGTSQTILIVETPVAVPWSKPADVPLTADGQLPKLTGLYSDDTFVVGIADTSFRVLHRNRISDKTLRAAITPSGGEVLGADWESGGGR
jgi:hypothetical protein